MAAKDGRWGIDVRNIFCIGRNYVKHIAELGNEVPDNPVVFLKPTSSLLGPGGSIRLPGFSGDVHFETELVVAIADRCASVPEEDALRHVLGYGIGLDLTARDVQDALKAKGLPWTVSKGFDTAACLSQFIPAEEVPDPSDLTFTLHLNGVLRQSGDPRLMLHSIPRLIAHLSTIFTLDRGDLIFTGTPEGVGRIESGDRLSCDCAGRVQAEFTVA